MGKIKSILISFLTVLLGGLIYISFRIESIRIFSWFNTINIFKSIEFIRNYTLEYETLFPEWIRFSLPDGLWLFSFISLVLIIWKHEINSHNLLWFIVLPLIAILSEIAQHKSIIPGTFDWVDLAMYALGLILPFIIYKKSLIIKFREI